MFYKIVVTENNNIPKILAFLFPHQIKKHGDIQDYLVSVNIIEALTGLDFFPELNDEDMERKFWEDMMQFDELHCLILPDEYLIYE